MIKIKVKYSNDKELHKFLAIIRPYITRWRECKSEGVKKAAWITLNLHGK